MLIWKYIFVLAILVVNVLGISSIPIKNGPHTRTVYFILLLDVGAIFVLIAAMLQQVIW